MYVWIRNNRLEFNCISFCGAAVQVGRTPLVAQAATYTTHNKLTRPSADSNPLSQQSRPQTTWPPGSAQFYLLMLEKNEGIQRKFDVLCYNRSFFLPYGNQYSYAKAFHILDLCTLHNRRNPLDIMVVTNRLYSNLTWICVQAFWFTLLQLVRCIRFGLTTFK
jgi:hypothetical protein